MAVATSVGWIHSGCSGAGMQGLASHTSREGIHLASASDSLLESMDTVFTLAILVHELC